MAQEKGLNFEVKTPHMGEPKLPEYGLVNSFVLGYLQNRTVGSDGILIFKKDMRVKKDAIVIFNNRYYKAKKEIEKTGEYPTAEDFQKISLSDGVDIEEIKKKIT